MVFKFRSKSFSDFIFGINKIQLFDFTIYINITMYIIINISKLYCFKLRTNLNT